MTKINKSYEEKPMKKSLIICFIIALLLIVLIAGIYFYLHSPKGIEISLTSCLNAGEIYQSPGGLGKIRGECCSGLIIMPDFPVPSSGNWTCEQFSSIAGNNLLCSACGNKICESEWENKCNCPADCK